jgi:valyl-tRNA synthetase
MEKELSNLKRSEAKLANSRFVENAPPAVVETERGRQLAHQAKLAGLKEQFEKLEQLGER